MLELVREAAIALQSETNTYPQGVQIWMKVMGASFFAGIFFAYSKVGARWIFAALLLNILGLVIGKLVFPEESRTVIGTYVHIVFWPPILWAVWRSAKKLSFASQTNNFYDWAYIAWLAWASMLMLISLAFDFRTLLFMWI
ncbi:MAG: hypothetical protein ACI90U_003006 [Pseudomonadales bacterium]|jgi:hypothetical protein